MISEKTTIKTRLLKITAFVLAAAVLVAAVWFFLKNTGAWLTDKGRWSDYSYTLGRIDYSLYINDNNIDLDSTQTYDTAVPITGGVKINDSAEVAQTADNYQRFAEENFNEGVTVVNIKIVNNSDFAININYDFEFDGLATDTAAPNDIFYLLLPIGSEVDTDNKTVTSAGGTAASYKNYVKSCLNDYSTYSAMRQSLINYYQANPTLVSSSQTVQINTGTQEEPIDGAYIDMYMLVWSEYNDELPFVTNGELNAPTQTPSSLSGSFTLSTSISQRTS